MKAEFLKPYCLSYLTVFSFRVSMISSKSSSVCSIADFKPGILFFGTCGLDHTWRTFVIQRIVRVYTDVSGNYTGTASG